ncbi:MAG: bZIP transcription factor [Thermoanaerobaculia bacterium]
MHRTLCASMLALMLAVAALPLRAQQASVDPAERLKKLEERLDQLQRENEALRSEIDALKGDLGTYAPATEPEDLTQIEAVPPPAQTPTPTETPTPPATTEAAPAEPVIDVVQNQPAPGAGKVFNPDIAVIGNFLGKVGDVNEFEDRAAASLEESEISFQAFVDPYAQAKFFLAVGPEGAEIEEGFINFIALPYDFTAKAGKLKANFGKINTMHTHVRPWIDQPLVLQNFFGDEGLADSGVSVSRIFPNGFNVFVEATGEVYSGDAEGVFEPENSNDLFYLGHLKAYHDLSEQSNLEVGTSYARGTAAEVGGSSEFGGVDVTYRYKPLERGLYRSFVSRTELIANRRSANDDHAFGFYTSADYQFAQRWFAGLRLDQADHVDDPGLTDRSASVTLTFWPSEFSQLRAQGRRIRYGNGPSVNELLMQVQFSIGAHGAHTF